MDDSDSGFGSVSSIILSSRTITSMSGDDRSTAGSRSSAASLSLSEVSSPAPSQLQTNSITNSNNYSNSTSYIIGLNQEPIRVWRDLEQETQIRHIHSAQHHPLMLTPPGYPGGPVFSLPISLLLPHPTNTQYVTDLWAKQQVDGHSRYEEDKLVRLFSCWR